MLCIGQFIPIVSHRLMSGEHVPLLFSRLCDLINVPKIVSGIGTNVSFNGSIQFRPIMLVKVSNFNQDPKIHYSGPEIVFLGLQYAERKWEPDSSVAVFLPKNSPFGRSYQLPGTDQQGTRRYIWLRAHVRMHYKQLNIYHPLSRAKSCTAKQFNTYTSMIQCLLFHKKQITDVDYNDQL